MPQRLAQFRGRREYASALGFDTEDEHRWRGGDVVTQYNIAPGRWPWVLHRIHQGSEDIDTVRWGYEPPTEGARLYKSVSVDFGMTEKFFRHMWRLGRCIVPLDGWYEFAANGTDPWYVRLRGGHTMLAAAITNFRPFSKGPSGTGFCLVTAGGPGFADTHDLRPAILTPEAARLWVDTSTSDLDAARLVASRSFAETAFHVYRVSRKVLSPDVNDSALTEPTD